MLRPPIISVLALLLLFSPAFALAQTKETTPERWEADIRAFEKADQKSPPPEGGVVFVGSSSIRLWKSLKEDFPDQEVIQRGFGGSFLSEVVHFADRIVLPYRPRAIVVYAGDNDLARGRSPEQVSESYKKLANLVQRELPESEILFLAIKPSLARWHLKEKIEAANAMVRDYTKDHERQTFIDIYTPMLGEDGKPRKELFVADGLHMTRAGYAIWVDALKPHLAKQ